MAASPSLASQASWVAGAFSAAIAASGAEISESQRSETASRSAALLGKCRWLDLLVSSKRKKALEEPELFATYVELTAGAREVVRAHVEALHAQLARILERGIAGGAFAAEDAAAAARAVFDATARFHNPVHAPEWSNPDIDAAYQSVRDLVLTGLTTTSHAAAADLVRASSHPGEGIRSAAHQGRHGRSGRATSLRWSGDR